VSYVDTNPSEANVTQSGDEEAKRIKRQRLRSTAIALGLAFLVILFYAATIVRMGGQASRSVGEFGSAGQSQPATTGAPANGGAP
jgi:hypothetical protein